MRPLRFPRHQAGMGIVETMVGILIGVVVLLVIYNVLSLAEGYKRTTIGVADTQTTGLFAQFVLNREISNSGNGIATGIPDFSVCVNGPTGPGDWRLKPIPVLITDSGNNNVSDGFVVFYSNTFQVTNPVLFLTSMAFNNRFNVQSPNGFADKDWVIATDKVSTCWLTQITGAPVPYAANAAQGGIDMTVSPVVPTPYSPALLPLRYPASSKILNLGHDVNLGNQIDRIQYTVDAAKRQLNSQVINPAPGVAVQPVLPVAQNVVLVKAQYGIDPTDTNIISAATVPPGFWTSAVPAAANPANSNGVDYSCNNSSNDALFASCNYGNNATAALIRTIKAVRIAVVVRSEEFDKDPALVAQPSQYLFNCSANTDAACQGRIKIDSGVGGVLADGYRHRIYETTIPLRNLIWNK